MKSGIESDDSEDNSDADEVSVESAAVAHDPRIQTTAHVVGR
jgi:hypothetical protein